MGEAQAAGEDAGGDAGMENGLVHGVPLVFGLRNGSY
jgi:hypothetical protein